MIIEIDPKTRIHGTDTCWQLERPYLDRGTAKWRPYKYFSTLGAAVREAAHAEIRTNPATTIADALEAVRAISHKYNDIVKAHVPRVSA